MLEKSVNELKEQLEKGQGDTSFSDRELNRQIVALDDVSQRLKCLCHEHEGIFVSIFLLFMYIVRSHYS